MPLASTSRNPGVAIPLDVYASSFLPNPPVHVPGANPHTKDIDAQLLEVQSPDPPCTVLVPRPSSPDLHGSHGPPRGHQRPVNTHPLPQYSPPTITIQVLPTTLQAYHGPSAGLQFHPTGFASQFPRKPATKKGMDQATPCSGLISGRSRRTCTRKPPTMGWPGGRRAEPGGSPSLT